MVGGPARPTRSDTPFPDSTLFRCPAAENDRGRALPAPAPPHLVGAADRLGRPPDLSGPCPPFRHPVLLPRRRHVEALVHLSEVYSANVRSCVCRPPVRSAPRQFPCHPQPDRPRPAYRELADRGRLPDDAQQS